MATADQVPGDSAGAGTTATDGDSEKLTRWMVRREALAVDAAKRRKTARSERSTAQGGKGVHLLGVESGRFSPPLRAERGVRGASLSACG